MKKISLLLIVSLCMLGSCKDDLLKEGGENGLTTEGTNYMAFNIVSDGGGAATRADWPGDYPAVGDFAGDPEAEEQAITSVQGSNVAIFFDEKNIFHSMRELTRVINGSSSPVEDEGRGKDEVSVGKFVANLKITEGGATPAKVLIVLNGNPSRLSQLEDSVNIKTYYTLPGGGTPKDDADYVLSYLTRRLSDDAINKENASIVLFSPSDEGGSSTTEYCTMSNAVYVGTGDLKKDQAFISDPNSAKGQKGDIYNLVTIGTDNIQATADEAALHPLTIHVDRLAVKVEVNIDNKDGKMTVTPYGDKSGVVGNLKFPIVIEPEATNKVLKMGEGATTVAEKQSVPWAFTMLGWSTNAVARRMYLFKNLNDSRPDINGKKDGSFHHNETENKIDEPFFSYWNDAVRARCYWAVDGHYADPTAYPVQYRYSKDNKATNTYKDMTASALGEDKTAKMPLYYYSYTQMRMISMGLKPNTDLSEINEDGSNYKDFLLEGNLRSNLNYRYCGENVLGQKLIDDPNHVWRGASTHVVFFGQLLLGEKEISDYKGQAKNDRQSTPTLLNLVSDKLYAGGCYWDRAGYMKNAYTTIWRALTSAERTITNHFGTGGNFSTPKAKTTDGLYYQKGDDERTREELTSLYLANIDDAMLNAVHDNFDYTQPDCNGADETDTECIFRLSAAQVSNGDGRVMLGLKKGYKLVIIGTVEGKGEETVTIDEGQFLSLAYEFAGVADFYAHGRMYYYAPIYHAIAGTAATGGVPTHVGDIGVVRNHWYKLTVSSLLKPGIPVSDPTQPIIPNIDPTDKYLGLEIHVLPWHLINQTVTLQ